MEVDKVLKNVVWTFPKRITAERRKEIVTRCLTEFREEFDDCADIENRLFYTSPEVINRDVLANRERLMALRNKTLKEFEKKFRQFVKDNFTDIKQIYPLFTGLISATYLVYKEQNKRYTFTI